MFGRPLRLGRIFGINVAVSWSFLLLVALLVVIYGTRSGAGLLVTLVAVAVSLFFLFGSILLHELGHSLVARRLGVEVLEIELHIFGGAAKMLSMPERPRDEILIAAAGPAVSFGLAAAFGLAWLLGAPLFWVLPGLGGLLAALVAAAAYVNLVLGAFNLLPALPMDGGRILRAALASRLGNLRATEIAVLVARVVAGGMVLTGILTGHLMLIAVAVFVWILGSRELRLARAAHRHAGADFDVLDPDGVVVQHFRGSAASQSGAARRSGPQPAPAGPARRSAAPSFSRPEVVTRHTILRGPDGRFWIVTSR